MVVICSSLVRFNNGSKSLNLGCDHLTVKWTPGVGQIRISWCAVLCNAVTLFRQWVCFAAVRRLRDVCLPQGWCGRLWQLFVLLHHAELSGHHKACFYLRGRSGAVSGDRPSLSSSAWSHAFPSFGLTIKYQLHFRLIQIWELGAHRTW